MLHSSKPRPKIRRGLKHPHTHQKENTPHISDAVRSWIKNVIAPALARTYLAEQALRKGEVRA